MRRHQFPAWISVDLLLTEWQTTSTSQSIFPPGFVDVQCLLSLRTGIIQN